jgi:hypothetical protein
MDDTQFNVELPKNLVAKIRLDAVKSGRSAKDVARVILGEFYSKLAWAERQKLYAKLPGKLAGRKVATRKKMEAEAEKNFA